MLAEWSNSRISILNIFIKHYKMLKIKEYMFLWQSLPSCYWCGQTMSWNRSGLAAVFTQKHQSNCYPSKIIPCLPPPPPLLTIVDLKILSVVSTPALVLCLYYRDEYVYYIAPKIEENGSTLNEKCLRSLETTGLELFSNFFQKHPWLSKFDWDEEWNYQILMWELW